MTYPPQQPGPYGQDPYGQQNPYGQPDPYGQQSGQFGQQAYPGGGYPGGGYPGGEPPKKSRTGLIIAVVAIAVLVLGGAGTGIYFLTKGDDKGNAGSENKANTSSAKPKSSVPGVGGGKSKQPSESRSPKPTSGGGGGGAEAEIIEVAEKYADAVTKRDESAAKELNCTKSSAGILYDTANSPNTKVEVTGKPEMIGSDSASIELEVIIGSSEPIPFPVLMSDEGGWCIST